MPAALQEVLRNMDTVLAAPLSFDRVSSLLAERRTDRPLTLAGFLDMLLRDDQGTPRHKSRSERVIARLTGIGLNTVQDVLRGVRRRAGAPAEPSSVGGRPTKRKLELASSAGGPEPPDPELAELMEGTIRAEDLQQQPEQQRQEQHQSVRGAGHKSEGLVACLKPSAREIGLMIGGLAAYHGLFFMCCRVLRPCLGGPNKKSQCLFCLRSCFMCPLFANIAVQALIHRSATRPF